jgi:hypothetical protein
VVTGSSSPWMPAAEGRGGDQPLVLHSCLPAASHAPPRASASPRPFHRLRPPPSFTVDSPSSLTPATRRTGCNGRPFGRLEPFLGAYSRSPGGGNRGIVTAGGMLDQGEEESRVGNRGVVTAGCMLDQGEEW